MLDRLEDIKARRCVGKNNEGLFPEDIDWLIGKVNKLMLENFQLFNQRVKIMQLMDDYREKNEKKMTDINLIDAIYAILWGEADE